ncbi:hypothetical protein BH10PSE18_BH10PSE18_18830 [soil metagenome]
MSRQDASAGPTPKPEEVAAADEKHDLMRGASAFKPLVFLALPYVLISAIVAYRLWW